MSTRRGKDPRDSRDWRALRKRTRPHGGHPPGAGGGGVDFEGNQ